MNLTQQIQSIISQQVDEWDFLPIAEEILFNYVLQIQQSTYRLTEVECYLNNEERAFDMFAHSHKGFTTGQLRLHGAGIDISIQEKNFNGGFLLRGMVEIDDDLLDLPQYIDGPWKLAQNIINKASIYEERFILSWKRCKLPHKPIITSPRVGLNLKSQLDVINQLPYLFKNWRFLTSPFQTNNAKYLIAISLLKEGKSVEDVSHILNIKPSTIQNYQKYIEEGKKLHKEDIKLLGNSIADKCRSYGFYISIS